MQVSELFSIEQCDHAVMDFLTATEAGKFRPKRVEESGVRFFEGPLVRRSLVWVFSFVLINQFAFFCHRERWVA